MRLDNSEYVLLVGEREDGVGYLRSYHGSESPSRDWHTLAWHQGQSVGWQRGFVAGCVAGAAVVAAALGLLWMVLA